MMTAANATFISSSHASITPPSRYGTRENRGGKGRASGVQNCWSE